MITLVCWVCAFCGQHVHVSPALVAVCGPGIVQSAVGLHLAAHADEMATETEEAS